MIKSKYKQPGTLIISDSRMYFKYIRNEYFLGLIGIISMAMKMKKINMMKNTELMMKAQIGDMKNP